MGSRDIFSLILLVDVHSATGFKDHLLLQSQRGVTLVHSREQVQIACSMIQANVRHTPTLLPDY